MVLKKILLSYDDEEHKEVHDFLKSLTKRGDKSKFTRIAIKEYIDKHTNKESEEIKTSSGSIASTNNTTTSNADEKEKQEDTKEDEIYQKVQDNFYELGK